MQQSPSWKQYLHQWTLNIHLFQFNYIVIISGRSKKEATQRTNRPDPCGHTRKTLQKLVNNHHNTTSSTASHQGRPRSESSSSTSSSSSEHMTPSWIQATGTFTHVFLLEFLFLLYFISYMGSVSEWFSLCVCLSVCLSVQPFLPDSRSS